ncbi:MAG TPA: DNA gyrase inhibitor YacG [Acidobacteriota bacterium]|nr:DNA gyrase inhibitor YacG [Acidobacteriota bacterium]HRR26861.1 DNA gyrase inhibitor YacG [Acidobacteriota bacterium]
MKRKRNSVCPTCRKPVSKQEPEFPFCSRRCRLIDLGRWADGDFRIPGEETSRVESGRENQE